MKLYYAPGACSLADHIALEEAGLAYDKEKVDLRAHKTESGRDFTEINPKGYVPALELDDGQILTENVAVLCYIGEKHDALLPGGMKRWRAIEMLTFTSSEIHHGFTPFFLGGSDEEKKAARDKLGKRFEQAAAAMDGRDYLVGDSLSVADCYMFVMLMWAKKNEVPVPEALTALAERLRARPAFQTALADEGLG